MPAAERSGFRSPLFYAGILMYVADAVLWTVVLLGDRTVALGLAAAFGAFLAGGKLVGLSAGIAAGGHPWVVAFLIALADVGTVFVLYPFTDTGLRALGRRFRKLGRSLERARERGHRGEGFIARWGPWGLFVITLLPTGYYSPVVVATVGHVLGIRAWAVLVPVGAASFVSSAAYAFLLDAGFAQAAAIDRRIPWILTGILVVGFPLGRWLWKRLRGTREEDDDAEAS